MNRPTAAPTRRTLGRPWAVALAIYVAVTAICFATTARQRLISHTPYNHFALLAQGWLAGRLDLGGPPPAYTGQNDFAVYEGRYYVSFPPLPAVLLVPSVQLAGSAERVKDGQFFAWFTGIGPAFLFLALDKLRRGGRSRRSERENMALALLFAFGSVYWFTAVQGTVWFTAHVIGVALAAIYLYAALDAAHPWLAGLALGLGFATRPPLGFAVALFVYEAMRASARSDPPSGATFAARIAGLDLRLLAVRYGLFALPAATVLGAILWHNHARFGDPFEFGHGLLAIGWRGRIDRWGLLSYHYLGRNLAVILTGLPFTGVAGTPFQINAHGLALWVTTPLYAWAIWPKRTGGLFWALAVTAACVALPSLLYQNSGWIQFGYRFSNDFAVFLFAMVAVGDRRLSLPFWLLAAAAVAINGFGAMTFQRSGFERFYYLDRTQKVLHQPD